MYKFNSSLWTDWRIILTYCTINCSLTWRWDNNSRKFSYDYYKEGNSIFCRVTYQDLYLYLLFLCRFQCHRKIAINIVPLNPYLDKKVFIKQTTFQCVHGPTVVHHVLGTTSTHIWNAPNYNIFYYHWTTASLSKRSTYQ